MKFKEKAVDFAKSIYDYDRLDYMGIKDGYEIYFPITYEEVAIGLPFSILANDNEIRTTKGYEECFDVIDYFEGKKPKETIYLKDDGWNK